jgi:hypothetical protein
LGHGFTANSTIQHDYFGTHRVIDDLNRFTADADGTITVLPQNVVRDEKTKNVTQIA